MADSNRNKRSNNQLLPRQKRKANFYRFGIPGLLLAGILGVLQVTNISGVNDLHTTPSCGADNLHTLNWGSGANQYDWLAGALSTTYQNVDGSGVDFTFNYSGEVYKLGAIGSGQTPNVQDFFPNESIDALSHYVTSGFSGSENITLTIDFSPAIPGQIAFDFYHINGTASSGDRVTTYAVPVGGGANIYPTVTDDGNPSWSYLGNGIIDANSGSTSGTRAYAGVNFNSASRIEQLVIIYEDCGICGDGVHGFAIGDIDFCAASPTDTDNDNIADKYDIDDDNDGITDHVESCGTSQSIPNSSIQIDIQFDNYANETSWTLKDESNSTVASGGPYTISENNQFQTFSYSASPGVYTLELLDSYGDGLSYSGGYYQLRLNGTTITSQIENFGSSGLHQILVPVLDFGCLSGDPSEDDDNDGIVNYQDSDFCTLSSNGICQSLETNGHGIPAYLDLDSDDDGIPDIVEAGGADSDGTGTVDATTDSDNDGLADVFESGHDWTSSLLDADGDGVNEISGDFDQDNAPNWLDLDSDDDGIPDVEESFGTDNDDDSFIDSYGIDIDNDGFADGVDGDVGNDGVAENTNGALVKTSADGNGDGLPDSGYPFANQDNSGKPNFLDIDADDDGIVDNTEAQPTNSFIAPSNSDTDGDGIDDNYDNSSSFGGNGLSAVNTENSGVPDYMDLDTDDDGENDIIEGHDTNGDGLVNGSDSPNARTGLSNGSDADNDGLDDGFDNNTSSADPTNNGLSCSSHPIFDLGVDRDWRSAALLPVKWLDIKAKWSNTDAVINWEVAEQQNNTTFQIERSKDARFFEPAGTIKGENSTHAKSYEFTDKNVGTDQRDVWYYRIKQIDVNGAFSHSSIVELKKEEVKTEFSMKVFPNPAKDFIEVGLSSLPTEPYSLVIVDITGKEIYKGKFRGIPAKIPVNQLPNGNYTLILSSTVGQLVKSVMVQH